MKNTIKIPRILKIKSVDGYLISCVFNNGETRIIDFKSLLNEWKVSKKDPEFKLFDKHIFKKVSLRNNTLSWKDIKVELVDANGNLKEYPFDIDPLTLYNNSDPSDNKENEFYFGPIIKKCRISKGLSQDDLAKLSGTSKTYISRIENNKIEPEFSTLYKIVEIGLGKKLKVDII